MCLLPNTHGIYDNGETVAEIRNIEDAYQYVLETKSAQGTGGMASKLDAALIAQQKGIETWLVNGKDENFLINAMNDEVRYTRVLRKES